WDSGQKWGQINTAAGVYNWAQMDQIVHNLPATAGLTGPMDIEYTFGYTPQWAGPCASAPDPSTCLPGSAGVTVAPDGATTTGSKILTSPSGGFGTYGSNIVGATLTIAGAGVSGASLTTTVASFQSANQVTLAGAASTTVSGKAVTSAFGGGQGCASPSDYSC